MDAAMRTTLDANKREMFDGMRAYHQSELAHKADAISMLKTILTGVGAVFAGVVVPSTTVPNAAWIAFLTAVAASAGTYLVVAGTNAKIDADHQRYADFGKEYVQTSQLLGLYDEVTSGTHRAVLKTSQTIGQGGGYRHSQHILTRFGLFVALLAWVAFAYVMSVPPKAPGASMVPAGSAASAPAGGG